MNNVCIDGGTLTDAMRSLIGSAASVAKVVSSRTSRVGKAKRALSTAHNTRGMRFIARSSGEGSERFHRAALRAEIGPLVEWQRAIDLPVLERQVMRDREVFFRHVAVDAEAVDADELRIGAVEHLRAHARDVFEHDL